MPIFAVRIGSGVIKPKQTRPKAPRDRFESCHTWAFHFRLPQHAVSDRGTNAYAFTLDRLLLHPAFSGYQSRAFQCQVLLLAHLPLAERSTSSVSRQNHQTTSRLELSMAFHIACLCV